MKNEEYIESIYGCLERIENKINGLSIPQSANGKSEVNNGVSESSLLEVKQDLDTVKTAFKRVMEALVMIKTDTANMLKRDSTSDKFSGLLSEFRNAQLQNFESQKNLLERFTATETRNLQQVVEKVEMLSASVKGRMSKPDKVRHLFVFDLASKPTWALLMVNMFLFAAFGSALYFARQPDYDRIDNDLKYRYIKMKGEASPEQLMDLEDVFGINRNNTKISQMRNDVEAYEDAVRKQAALSEQARLKEQAAKELNSKAKFIKDKAITDKPKK